MAKHNAKQFYRSKEWAVKRLEVLCRDNYECQECKRKGRYSKATCVHHIKHLFARWDLRLTASNLVSLCDSCHNVEHPEKLHKNHQRKTIVNDEKW